MRQRNDIDTRLLLDALRALGMIGPNDTELAALTPLGLWAVRRQLGEAGPGDPAYQLMITLLNMGDPPVWRRLLVSASIRLDRLHSIIQAVMGLENYHLHYFLADGVRYGVPDPDWGTDVRDERETRLGDLVSGAGTRIGYTYDFGDDWEHDILIEQVVTAGEGEHYPRFLAGEGACPPEDCGGWPGYERLRGVLADPHHPERESMLGWLGLDRAASFDPGNFDAERANAALARIG